MTKADWNSEILEAQRMVNRYPNNKGWQERLKHCEDMQKNDAA